MTALLDVRGVSRRFRVGGFQRRKVTAVDGVTFSIDEGETLGLVGESGCGKSTLGRVLVGLLEPSAGTVLFGGAEIGSGGAELRQLRRNVQMIFQDPFASLNPRMTVRDIVAEPLRNFGIARGGEADRLVAQTLDVCGLSSGAMSRYPAEFSGGQRQRVGIARALVLKPSFIVADEPVSALDVSIQAQIINLLGDLQTEFGITYLFIAHDLSVVRHISARVAVMYLGRIVEIGRVDDVFAAPAHPYTRVLLSSVPRPNPQEERKRRPILLDGDPPSPLALPSGCRFHRRCPWAQLPLCSEHDPTDVVLGHGHSAACHFAGQLGALPPKMPIPAT